MKTRALLVFIFGVVILTSNTAKAANEIETVFQDTFNVSAQSNDVNFENSLGRQSGSADVLTYLENTGGATDASSQLNAADAPGQLRLEASASQSFTAISPNHNFVEGGDFAIEFDLDAGQNDPTGTSGDWACVVFGTSSPLAFVNSSDGMGILFRNNGVIQVFDGSTDTQGGGSTPLGKFHVRVEVSTVGFSGTHPATVRLFVDGTALQLGAGTLEYFKASGFRGNYITLAGAAWGGTWVHVFDNLIVTATPCIRPWPPILESYVGQSNQTVTVTIPDELNLTAPVDVIVTSANPAVAVPLGGVGGSLTLTFPVGGTTEQSFTVAALGNSTTTLNLSSTADACVSDTVLVQVGATFLANPSFENNLAPDYPPNVGYGSIDQWTQLAGGGVGVNDADGPFADNGAIPDRAQAAFVQGTGGLSQFVTALAPGEQHWLQFYYNVRNCCGGTMSLDVRFAGQSLGSFANIQPGMARGYYFKNLPFTPAADSGLLEFVTTAAGDASLVLDAATIIRRGTNQLVVVNPSFEASGVVPDPGYVGPLPIAGWLGTGNYGVNVSGSGPFADNGTNPDQDSVAFIQGAGSLGQVNSSLAVGQEYQIAYSYNARFGDTPYLRVSMGGTTLQEEGVSALGDWRAYYRRTNTWMATGSSATLLFEQLDDFGDVTVLIDDVQVVGLAVPPCETTLSVQNAEFFSGQPVGPSSVVVTLPAYLVATQSVEVLVISLNPAVAVPAGGAGGTLALQFTAGGPNSLSFDITALGSGTTSFLITNRLDCASAVLSVRNRTCFVLNPSFEDNSTALWPGYNPIASWTGPSGLNPITVDHADGRSPFADNGLTPDRGQVAFIQLNASETKSLSQMIYGLDTTKQYWLQAYLNARNCCGDFPSAAALFNGVELASVAAVPAVDPLGTHANSYYFVNLPFRPTVSMGELAFVSGPTATGGDRTLLLDAVSIVERNASQVVLQNPSFEASGSPPWPGTIQPARLAGWTGLGSYGVNISGAGPFADNGAALDQDNVAFLQGQGSSISQTVDDLAVGGSYALSYAYNARLGNAPRLTVSVDGTVVHDQLLAPVGGSASYLTTNIVFTASASTMVLTFAQTAPGDQTVLIDDVRILAGPTLGPQLNVQLFGSDPLTAAVRISWLVSWGEGWILQATTELPGGFVDTGLPAQLEGAEYAVYDTTASGKMFYRVIRR